MDGTKSKISYSGPSSSQKRVSERQCDGNKAIDSTKYIKSEQDLPCSSSEEPPVPPADTVCRVCLIKNLNLFIVTNDLQNFYGTVTREEYNKPDYPVCMCYICLAELRRCHRFVETARDSNRVLEQWYSQQHKIKENKPQITNTVTKEESISSDNEEIPLQHIKEEKMHLEPEYAKSGTIYFELKKEDIDEQTDNKHDPNDGTYGVAVRDDSDRQQEGKCPSVEQAAGTSGELCQLEDGNTETTTTDKIEIEINTGSVDSNKHCSECNFKCVTESGLSRHMRFHDSNRRHVCDVCRYRFDDLIHLQKHKAMHKVDDAIEYSCEMCDFKTLNKHDFDNHMTSNTGHLISCYICDYKCREKRRFADHMRSHTGERPYSCGVCSEKFVLKSTLKQHCNAKHTIEKPFSCSYCSFKTSRKDALRSHMRTHTGEKPFSCEICHLQYRNKRRLTDHMRKHTDDPGEKPFLCDICSYKFSSKHCLQQHVKSIHNNEKPFSCNICNYKTSRKDALKPHMRTHTGEKPYSCDMCDYKSSRKGNVKKHFLTVHKI